MIKLSDKCSEGNIVQVVYRSGSSRDAIDWHFRGELVEFVPVGQQVSREKLIQYYGEPRITKSDQMRMNRMLERGKISI